MDHLHYHKCFGTLGLSLSVWVAFSSGFAESSSVQSVPTTKAAGEVSSASLPASTTETVHPPSGIEDGVPSAVAAEKIFNAVTGDYLIGAEDVLEISVWRNQDLSRVVQVRPDGRISLPVVRDIVAIGKSPTQLSDEITKRLKEYVQNPVVAISVKEVNSYNVFVLGEVVKPGKYPLKSRTTLLQGITMAGGFSPVAARNQVVIFRFSEKGGGKNTINASYDDIVLRGAIGQDLELKAGDTVVVPSETMVVFPGQK